MVRTAILIGLVLSTVGLFAENTCGSVNDERLSPMEFEVTKKAYLDITGIGLSVSADVMDMKVKPNHLYRVCLNPTDPKKGQEYVLHFKTKPGWMTAKTLVAVQYVWVPKVDTPTMLVAYSIP